MGLSPFGKAAALGDIGEHYPDTDPKWRGLDSSRLLAEVVELLARRGFRAVNCDVIVHAQEPKLGAFKAAIRSNLAGLLRLPVTEIGALQPRFVRRTTTAIGNVQHDQPARSVRSGELESPDGHGSGV